jgi:hypothetical protein
MTEHSDATHSLSPAAVLRHRPSPDLEWVEIDGEVVAWVAADVGLHLLDPAATVVFRLCDGVTPLSATARDIAEAFGGDLAAVESDVVQAASSLVRVNILEEAR